MHFQSDWHLFEMCLFSPTVKRIKEHLDKLFDISSCYCKLPVRCNDLVVEGNKENCQTRHIVCIFLPNKKVGLILELVFNLLCFFVCLFFFSFV